jgi:hypothetical protein
MDGSENQSFAIANVKEERENKTSVTDTTNTTENQLTKYM